MENIRFSSAQVLISPFIPEDVKEYFLNKLETDEKFTYEKLKEIIVKSRVRFYSFKAFLG